MIIRNHQPTFVMIEQDHHGHIAEEMIQQWIDFLLQDDPYMPSVLYAIRHHDCGWKPFDQQPFWNDQTNMPYAFTDFPVLPKTVLYTQGIDEVEAIDSYAAALCSAHYLKFMTRSNTEEAKHFINKEKKRIQHILTTYPDISTDQFEQHVAILQFADNLSLYMCLNEPGVAPKDEHVFFKQGIPISNVIYTNPTQKIHAYWQDTQTIILSSLPYVEPFTVSIQQKSVSKQVIKKQGILTSYAQTPYEEVHITLYVK